MKTISVPIETSLFTNTIRALDRENNPIDPVDHINELLRAWLEDTPLKRDRTNVNDENNSTFTGYQWKNLLLPSGTRVRMKYQRKYFYAEVVGDDLIFENISLSPSQFANKVTQSSRNAWRDLELAFPGKAGWHHAMKFKEDTIGGGISNQGVALMKSKRGYKDDLVDVLLGFVSGRASRPQVIKEVKKLRLKRGEIIPRTFDDVVQGSFEGYCVDSDNFEEGRTPLFCWPEGKGAGMWGVRMDAAENYVRLRDRIL